MKRIIGIVTALLTLFLTSCITIEEIYTFNSDGSGSMKYVIDMGEMATMLKAFGGDEENEETSELDTSMREASVELESKAKRLSSIKGISGITNSSDEENFVFTLSFDFKDIDALNAGLNEILKDSADTQFHQYFIQKGKTLQRNSLLGSKLKSAMGLEDESDENDEEQEMANMMLEQMKYNLTFNFNKGVKSVKTKSTVGKLSSDKKTYTMETNFKQLAENGEMLDANFKLK